LGNLVPSGDEAVIRLPSNGRGSICKFRHIEPLPMACRDSGRIIAGQAIGRKSGAFSRRSG
jgi:hypothetical protein